MNLIAREKASHWYLADGTPYHTVERADGKGLRPVTLRDARKVGAYPSVTNVLGTIAKPALDAWKVEQGIMAALTLPKGATEPMDVYARRVVEDMDAQVTVAAVFGTAVHKLCQTYLEGKLDDAAKAIVDDKVLAHWEPWKTWCDHNVFEVRKVEKVVVNQREGYAGTMDLECYLRGFGWSIVDFKTQKVRRVQSGEKRPTFYETWLLQLIAYADAINEPTHRFVNVVIDTEEAGPPIVQAWEDDPAAWAAWAAALNLWTFMRGYRPPVRSARLKNTDYSTDLSHAKTPRRQGNGMETVVGNGGGCITGDLGARVYTDAGSGSYNPHPGPLPQASSFAKATEDTGSASAALRRDSAEGEWSSGCYATGQVLVGVRAKGEMAEEGMKDAA